MRDVIEFIETRTHRTWLSVPNHYEFKPRGRAQFLQRWAWRFLQRRGALAQAVTEHLEYTRHRIDTRDLMRRLIEQRRASLEMGFEPEELLIGSEDFAELMGYPQIQHAVSFDTTYNRGYRIYDLRVRIIPWMRGMLAMPKERA